MRLLALLVAIVSGLIGASMPDPAAAIESKILDTLNKWLSEDHEFGFGSAKPDVNNPDGLRRLAGKGDAEAHLLLFKAYDAIPRGGAGPRVASKTLLSRAEAEDGLRAAAAQNQPEAILLLGAALFRGEHMLRDDAEARKWLEAALERGRPEDRPVVEYLLGELLLFSPGLADADRVKGAALTESALQHGVPAALRSKANALRRGIGVAQDAVGARRLLEEGLRSGNDRVYAALGDMLVKGEGGPQDLKRGLAILADTREGGAKEGKMLLAKLYLEGKLMARDPRRAIELLAPYALFDLATRQQLAAILVDHRVQVANADALFLRFKEDEDVGEPDGAWTLLHLMRANHEQFRDEELMFEVISRNKGKDDRVALVDAEYLAKWSTDSKYSQAFAKNARGTIDRLIAKDMAAAWTLKGTLERKGWVYPQDDVAATQSFKKGAELGDVAAMLDLSDAYDDGLGIDESYEEELRWLRRAAELGSVEARSQLVGAFTFDWGDRKMTLREGITEAVALYGNGAGYLDSYRFAGMFSGGRISDFDPEEIVQAFMDGFRLAPSAAADDRLAPLKDKVPEEIWIAVETTLKKEGFYKGETKGYMGPEARAALLAWAVAKGPPPEAENPSEVAPLVGPALPQLPPEILNAALRHAFEKVDAAKTDADWSEALAALAPLARYGEPISRWALLRWYDQSSIVGQAVTPAELTRYGIDLLLTNDPRMEKLSIEFNFAMAELWKADQENAFAEGFLTALRDDPRLRDKQTLDDILHDLIFIPGGCDMLLAGAKVLAVEGLPEDDCANRETRDALLAFAVKQGDSGVEAKSRAAAIPEIYKVAGAPPP